MKPIPAGFRPEARPVYFVGYCSLLDSQLKGTCSVDIQPVTLIFKSTDNLVFA